MKTILLVAGGRTGNEFFHSLLDSHSEILQFPGILKVDTKFIRMLDNQNINQIPKTFINLFPYFFDSRLNKLERLHKLGKKRNQFFIVNKNLFINYFQDLMIGSKKNRLKVLIKLHQAYYKARNLDINNKKIMLINSHLFEFTKKFIDSFGAKNTEIICTIRHPLSSLSSQIKNNLIFESGNTFFAKDLYNSLNICLKNFYLYLNLCKVKVVRLENLHKNHKKVLLDFCAKYNLKFNKSMTKSTFLGLEWWGDSFSKKWVKGFNKKFEINVDNKYFYKKDIILFQNLSENLFNCYNYDYLLPTESKKFDLLPLKSELLVWKNSLLKFYRLKRLLSIPIFYFLRVIFFSKFFFTKRKLPYSFGDKKL